MDESEVVLVAAPPDRAPASAPRSSRRCVQKKLVFGVGSGGESEESEEERKGKRKRKEKARSGSTSKAPSLKKEASGSRKADFFTKVSEKKSQQKQGKDHIGAIGSDDCCEVLDSMNGSHCQTLEKHSIPTPKRKTPKKYKESPSKWSKNCKQAVSSKETVDKDQPVLDLWMEAKTAAEENQRLFAGKQTHPFFSCMKPKKRVFEGSEYTPVQNRSSLALNGCSPPIHVFDKLQDESASLNWSNWVFSDRSLVGLNGCRSPESLSLRIFEDSIRSPDDLSNLSNIHESLSFSRGIPMDQILSEEPGMPVRLTGRHHTHIDDSYSCHSLWTHKYQPEKSSEVCGNQMAVGFINEWLKSWLEKGLQSSKKAAGSSLNMTIDISDASYSSDYDSEFEDEDDQLRNVLLVTGPVGSGKSAAIYACAKEHGFEVIEVNASDHRNGALVKQKFGEATESLGLDIRSFEDHLGSAKGHTIDLNLTPIEDIADDEFKADGDEVNVGTCNQNGRVSTPSGNAPQNKTTICQVSNRSLILFEDVDTVFDEDRGFLSTILQLAKTSKRPIILTANSNDPLLPQVLDRDVVKFILPSHKELLSHVSMICAAEGAPMPPSFLEKFIRSCQADIRKTILHLQFWCQNRRDGIASDKQCTDGVLELDLDKVHLVIPKVVPWGFPCKLSEKIISEISKIDISLKGNSFVMNGINQQKSKSFGVADTRDMDHCEAVMIMNGKNANCMEFSPMKNGDDSSSVSGTPVKFIRRTTNRNCSTVLSSESGDEEEARKLPLADYRLSCANSLSPNASLVPASHAHGYENYPEVSQRLAVQSQEHESHDSLLLNFGFRSESYIFDGCRSLDASCVPESNLVAETEIDHEADFISRTHSHGNSLVILGETTAHGADTLHNFPEIENGSLGKNQIDLNCHPLQRLENTFMLLEESVHGSEDLRDLESRTVHFVARDCQLMDECSRADFSMGLVSNENCGNSEVADPVQVTCKDDDNYSAIADPVQETWSRLRTCCQDFKTDLASNVKSASRASNLTMRTSDLICDADIMLVGCESLLDDNVDMLMATPGSFSWHDNQLEMTSTLVQNGLSFLGKKLKLLESELAGENMMSSQQAVSSSTMALGKTLSHANSCNEKCTETVSLVELPTCSTSLIRESESKVYGAILPIVPERMSMAIKGHAFHEYSSSLSQIAKIECSRSEGIKQRRRRGRASLHHLKSCPLPLSSEEIELFSRHCCFGGVGYG